MSNTAEPGEQKTHDICELNHHVGTMRRSHNHAEDMVTMWVRNPAPGTRLYFVLEDQIYDPLVTYVAPPGTQGVGVSNA